MERRGARTRGRPGIGKTALVRALARSLHAEYLRIQCTNGLLPADVIGTNVFLQQEGRFDFRAYAARLRAILLGTEGRLPSLAERRRMRRELRRLPGWKAIVGSYLTIPPGAPRRQRRS